MLTVGLVWGWSLPCVVRKEEKRANIIYLHSHISKHGSGTTLHGKQMDMVGLSLARGECGLEFDT